MPKTITITTRGLRLRAARERRGLTQEELSRLADVTQASISRIETGDMPDPQGSIMVKLARTLGISVEWLYDV